MFVLPQNQKRYSRNYGPYQRGVSVLSYQNALIIAEFLDTTTDELFKEAFDHLYEEDRQRQWEKEHPRW